jgi:hypothetical protein
VPTWVLAALTLLAFGAAAFAGVTAYDLLFVENRRDAQAAVEELSKAAAAMREQAGKLAAWYGIWRSEITYRRERVAVRRRGRTGAR